MIALEPEAASIYCQLMHLESTDNKRFFLAGKESGAKYMVLDLGGSGSLTISNVYLKQELCIFNIEIYFIPLVVAKEDQNVPKSKLFSFYQPFGKINYLSLCLNHHTVFNDIYVQPYNLQTFTYKPR